MKKGYKILRDCVFHNPLGLSHFPSKMQGIASRYVPVSVGIEFECSLLKDWEEEYLTVISEAEELKPWHIIDFRLTSFEQTFRIYPGIKGMIGLYKVTQFLKKYYGLNMRSGIHYHIDCTENWHLVYGIFDNKDTIRYILTELDKWDYDGTYNARAVSRSKGGWFCTRCEYKTIEVRIGEMTFEYEQLMRRITHACNIVNRALNMVNVMWHR